MLERLNDLRQLIAGVAALLALYMYGVAYFALADYYQVFGLLPSDAGITQSTLVALALAGFGLLFGAFAILCAAGWATQRYIRNARDDAAFGRREGLAIVMGFLGAAMGAAVARELFTLGAATTAASVGVGLGASFVTRPSKEARPRPWLPAVLTTALIAVGWLFFSEVTTASERLAIKLMVDGNFRSATWWEDSTRLALGIPAVPAEVDGHACAVLIAFSGDHAWSMTSPGETVAIERIDRDASTVRYVTDQPAGPVRRRSCWTAADRPASPPATP